MERNKNTESVVTKRVGGKKPVVITPQVEKHVKMYKTENPKISVRDMRQRLVQDGVCTSAPSISSMSRLVRRLKANSDIPSGYDVCQPTISSYYDNAGTSNAVPTSPAVWGNHTASPQLGSSHTASSQLGSPEPPMGSKQPPTSDRQTPIHTWHTAIDGHQIPRGIWQNSGDSSKTAASDRQTPIESQPTVVTDCQTPIGGWKTTIGVPELSGYSWQNQAQSQQIPLYRQQSSMDREQNTMALGSWHTPVDSWHTSRATTPKGNYPSVMQGQHIPTGNWHVPTGSWQIPQSSWQNESWYTPIGKQETKSHGQRSLIDSQQEQTGCMDSEMSPNNARHTLIGGLQDSIGKFDNPVRRKLVLSSKKYKLDDQPQENKQDVPLDYTCNTVSHQKKMTPLNIWQVTMGGKHPVVNIHHTPRDSPSAESQEKQSRDGDHQLTNISPTTGANHETPIGTSKNGQLSASTNTGFSINATCSSLDSQQRGSKELQTSESSASKRIYSESSVTNSNTSHSSISESSVIDQSSTQKACFSSKDYDKAYLEGQSSSVNTNHRAQLGCPDILNDKEKSQWTAQKENSQPDSNKPMPSYENPMRLPLADDVAMKTVTDTNKTMSYYGNGHSMRLPVKIASACNEPEPDEGRPICQSLPSPTPLRKAADSNQAEPDHGHCMGLPLSVLRHKKRLIFSSDQLSALEELFSKSQFPEHHVKEGLAQHHQLPIKSVQTWFANRRQRWRKDLSAALSSPTDYEACTLSANDHHQRLPLAEIPDWKVQGGQAFTPASAQLHYKEQHPTVPEAATLSPPTHSQCLQNSHAIHGSQSKDARENPSTSIRNLNQDTVSSFGLAATTSKEQESPLDMAVQNAHTTALGNQAMHARDMHNGTVGGNSKDMLTSILMPSPCHTPVNSYQHWQPAPANSTKGEFTAKVHHLDAPMHLTDAPPSNAGAPAHHVDPTVHRVNATNLHVNAPLDSVDALLHHLGPAVHHRGAPVHHLGATVHHRPTDTPAKEQSDSTFENWYTGAPYYFQPGNSGNVPYKQYTQQYVAPSTQTVTHDARYPLEPYFHYTD